MKPKDQRSRSGKRASALPLARIVAGRFFFSMVGHLVQALSAQRSPAAAANGVKHRLITTRLQAHRDARVPAEAGRLLHATRRAMVRKPARLRKRHHEKANQTEARCLAGERQVASRARPRVRWSPKSLSILSSLICASGLAAWRLSRSFHSEFRFTPRGHDPGTRDCDSPQSSDPATSRLRTQKRKARAFGRGAPARPGVGR